MRVWRMAHILPNHCPGRCSICDLAKYTVSLFGRNCCLLYTLSVVCHINLTNGWMTVLLPCQIDTRQGLQVLYVIVGQKPLVCWSKLNNTKRVAKNWFFLFWTISSNSMSFQYMLYLHLLESRHTNVHVPVPLSQKLGRGTFFPNPDLFSNVWHWSIRFHTPFVVINWCGGGARFSPTQISQRCLTVVIRFHTPFCGN